MFNNQHYFEHVGKQKYLSEPTDCAGVVKAKYIFFFSSGLKDNNNGMQICLLMMQLYVSNAIN
jgi:hypothetical protein